MPDRKTRECGEILLHLKGLSLRTVSHECVHAAIGYARRLRLDPVTDDGSDWVSDDEERVAEAQSRMFAQFCWQAVRRKLPMSW